jgi:hypothetical protein
MNLTLDTKKFFKKLKIKENFKKKDIFFNQN